MQKRIIGLSLICASACLPVFAGTMGENFNTMPSFYMGAFGGYGVIDGAIKEDGNVAQGRLALGVRANQPFQHFLLGGELGIQSGNVMRLESSEEVVLLAGDPPFQVTLKPLLDALVTLKYQMSPDSPYSAIVKGGIAYRQMQFNDRVTPQDTLSKVNGEFQAGLGYKLTNNIQLTAMYQGIYSSSNANVQYTSVLVNDFFDIGYPTISRIPTQQAGFLGIEYTF